MQECATTNFYSVNAEKFGLTTVHPSFVNQFLIRGCSTSIQTCNFSDVSNPINLQSSTNCGFYPWPTLPPLSHSQDFTNLGPAGITSKVSPLKMFEENPKATSNFSHDSSFSSCNLVSTHNVCQTKPWDLSLNSGTQFQNNFRKMIFPYNEQSQLNFNSISPHWGNEGVRKEMYGELRHNSFEDFKKNYPENMRLNEPKQQNPFFKWMLVKRTSQKSGTIF